MGEGNSFSLLTFRGGGYLIQPWTGGKGSQVSDFWVGGVPGLRFSGRGGPRSQIFGGGPRSKISRGGGVPVSVKGKIFDTRFGLIHVQTGKKKFLSRDPRPSSKGKIF